LRADLRRYSKSQGGYTLVELIVASAIGVLVMTGLTSVVLTSWRAGTVATNRVEASSQVRSFEFYANDDFTLSGPPVITGCAPPGRRVGCTITLSGLKVTDLNTAPTPYRVTYTWDGTKVNRQVAGYSSNYAAIDVTAFSAVVLGAQPYQTVVVTMTLTVQAYSETQTLRFYPRVNP
jgi:prepilin-type N-terminal cleavage/methylation domain-containing protein